MKGTGAAVAMIAGLTGLVVGSFITAMTMNSYEETDRRPIHDITEGDIVQWESGGRFIFPKPRKVERIEEGEMGKYVFVEGSTTGIPVEQVIKIRDERHV